MKFIVVSGPFGGKSTLEASLNKLVSNGLDLLVWETDTNRRHLPGWRNELWPAWRRDHPLHKEWKALDYQHHADAHAALTSERNVVVIRHDVPYDAEADVPVIFIIPSTDVLNARMSEWIREKAPTEADASSRCEAARHYWSKPEIRPLVYIAEDAWGHDAVFPRSSVFMHGADTSTDRILVPSAAEALQLIVNALPS